MAEPIAVTERRQQIEPYRSYEEVNTQNLTSQQELAETRRRVELIKRQIENDPNDAQYRVGDRTLTKEEYKQYLSQKEVSFRQYETKVENYEQYAQALRQAGYDAYIDPQTGEFIKIPPKGMSKEQQIYLETKFYPGARIPLEGGGEITKRKAVIQAKQAWDGYKRTEALLADDNPLNALSIVAMFFTRPGMSGALAREVGAKIDLGWSQFSGATKEEIQQKQKEAFDAQWTRAQLQANTTYQIQSALDSGKIDRILGSLLPEIVYGITLATSYGISRQAGKLSAKAVAKYGATSGAVKTATAVKAAMILGMGTPIAYQIITTVKSIEKIETQKTEFEKQFDTRISKATTERQKEQLIKDKEYYLREYDRQLTYAYGLLINLGINTLIFIGVSMKGYKAGIKVGMKKYFYPGTKAVTTAGKQTVIGEQKTGKLVYQQEFKQQTFMKSRLTNKQMPISKPYKFRVLGKGQVTQQDKYYVGKGYGYKIPKGTLQTKSYTIQQYKISILGTKGTGVKGTRLGGYKWKTISTKSSGITGPRTTMKLNIDKKAGIKFKPEGYTELTLTEDQVGYAIFGKEGEFYPAVSSYGKGKTITSSKQLMQLREVKPTQFQQRVFIKGKYPGFAKFRTKYIEYQEPVALLPAKRSIWSSETATQMLVRPQMQDGLRIPKQIIQPQEVVSQIPITSISPKSDVIYQTKLITLSAQGLVKETITKPAQIVKTSSATLQSQKLGIAQATKVAQAQAQKTPQLTKQVTAQVPIAVPPPASIVNLSIPTPPPPEETPKPKKPKGKVKGYHGYAKEKGKWVKVTPSPLPKLSALGKAADVAENTPARSIKIEETKEQVVEDNTWAPTWNKLEDQFRKPIRKGQKKVDSPIYIEKSKYNINTPGEIKGITVKGWMAQQAKVKPIKQQKSSKKASAKPQEQKTIVTNTYKPFKPQTVSMGFKTKNKRNIGSNKMYKPKVVKL